MTSLDTESADGVTEGRLLAPGSAVELPSEARPPQAAGDNDTAMRARKTKNLSFRIQLSLIRQFLTNQSGNVAPDKRRALAYSV